MRNYFCISKFRFIFAPDLRNKTNQRWRQHHKIGNKIMTANIEVSVKVYLYQQLENSARNNYCGELINYCEVYPTWEQAERCLKIIENRETEDGVPFETALGTIYQYHLNYKTEAGEQVWEIRHERFNKEGRLEYNSCKVIEKQF